MDTDRDAWAAMAFMNFISRFMMTAIVFSAAAFGAADGVEVSVSIDPAVIPFHRQAAYTITVEAPDNADVRLPDMVGHFGGANVYGVPEYREESIGGHRKRIRETYTLDAIWPGVYAIAAAEVRIGETDVVTSPSPALRVRALTEAEEAEAMKFEDGAPAALPPARWLLAPWQIAAIVAVVLIAAAVAAYLLWRRRGPAAPVIRKTPWEVAYERLKALDQRRLPEQGKFDSFYVNLSAILRYYIEDRFHVHAPEQTTPEFLGEVSAKGVFSADQQRMLGLFLRHCDRVKFARYEPSVKEMEASFAEVLRFVDETVPRPAESAEKAA